MVSFLSCSLCSLFLEFLLAKVCTSWIDFIIYYSLLFSLCLLILFWKIFSKFPLLFNFRILVILIFKVLSCFLMIPYFYSYFINYDLLFFWKYFTSEFCSFFLFEFCYGSYIVSGYCESLCCYCLFLVIGHFSPGVWLTFLSVHIWPCVTMKWSRDWGFQLAGFVVRRPLLSICRSFLRGQCLQRINLKWSPSYVL